jgi:hypothetical protein
MLAFLFSASAFAQVNVYVTATAKDSVGGQLVYQLRENLRASRGMNLVTSQDDAVVLV